MDLEAFNASLEIRNSVNTFNLAQFL